MSRTIRQFAPIENKTITFAAATASANVQFVINVPNSSPAVLPDVVVIRNLTDKVIFVTSGTTIGTTAVVATDMAILVGGTATIDVGLNAYVAAIPESSATGKVYISRGLGG